MLFFRRMGRNLIMAAIDRYGLAMRAFGVRAIHSTVLIIRGGTAS